MSKAIINVTIGLPVTNLNQASEWYRKLLGEVQEVSPIWGIWEACLSDGVTLQLFESETQPACANNVGFQTDDIERSHALAASLCDKVSDVDTVPDAVHYFQFSDPFGNLLSFYQIID